MAPRGSNLRMAWGRVLTLAVVLAATPLLAQSLPSVAPVPGPDDVRFTSKGETLYAFVLGWPKGPLTIHALGTPAAAPCDHAVAFAISGVIQPAAGPVTEVIR